MKLSEFIQHLQRIQKKYGDMDITGNVISGDNMDLVSLCIDTSDEEPTLFIELQERELNNVPAFSIYEE